MTGSSSDPGLAALLDALSRAGLRTGVPESLRLDLVLSSCGARDEATLIHLIAAVIAKSPAEAALVPPAVRAWLALPPEDEAGADLLRSPLHPHPASPVSRASRFLLAGPWLVPAALLVFLMAPIQGAARIPRRRRPRPRRPPSHLHLRPPPGGPYPCRSTTSSFPTWSSSPLAAPWWTSRPWPARRAPCSPGWASTWGCAAAPTCRCPRRCRCGTTCA